jgi:hypothetical protein
MYENSRAGTQEMSSESKKLKKNLERYGKNAKWYSQHDRQLPGIILFTLLLTQQRPG